MYYKKFSRSCAWNILQIKIFFFFFFSNSVIQYCNVSFSGANTIPCIYSQNLHVIRYQKFINIMCWQGTTIFQSLHVLRLKVKVHVKSHSVYVYLEACQACSKTHLIKVVLKNYIHYLHFIMMELDIVDIDRLSPLS